jgi:uncharacterized membrane protein YdbT with pleckstrin-like domain
MDTSKDLPELIGPDDSIVNIDPVDIELDTKKDREYIKWKGHPHISSQIINIVFAISLIVLGFIGLVYILLGNQNNILFHIISPLFILMGLISLFFIKFHIKYTRYVLTDSAVYKQTGWISDKVTKIPVDQLQTITYEQSIPEKLLNFGTVGMSTGGHEVIELEFKSVKNPKRVHRDIELQMEDRVNRSNEYRQRRIDPKTDMRKIRG